MYRYVLGNVRCRPNQVKKYTRKGTVELHAQFLVDVLKVAWMWMRFSCLTEINFLSASQNDLVFKTPDVVQLTFSS